MAIFNFNEIKDFDDHIVKSIPDFKTLDMYVREFVSAFQQKGTSVIDLGCSTGRLISSLERSNNVKYVGVDSSDLIPDSDMFEKKDVAKFSFPTSSVIISMFFLQFLTAPERVTVLKKIKDSLTGGGVFICCEKVHFVNSRVDSIAQSILLNWKRDKFTDTEILDKNFKLKNTMFLKNHEQLLSELSSIGEAVPFWQSQSFIGYIVIK